MSDVFDEFTWRGLVSERTEGLPELLARERVTAYIGFDPTASLSSREDSQVGPAKCVPICAPWSS